jgi:hypothetical protein
LRLNLVGVAALGELTDGALGEVEGLAEPLHEIILVP